VLSKGGVIFELGTKGGKSPMGAPANFPGRRCGSAPLGDKMFVAWLSATSHGLFVSALEPNEKPDELQLHKTAIEASLRKQPYNPLVSKLNRVR
jgi:hypothetical protein